MQIKHLPAHVLAACFLLPSVLCAVPWAQAIDRTGWTITADSSNTATSNGVANLIDGKNNTFWHTAYGTTVAALPHTVTVDMKKSYVVNGIGYLPRQDGNSNGNIGAHTITLSTDGTTWSNPIVFGTYLNDATHKTSFFSNQTARYVKLTITSEAQNKNNPWSSGAELNIYSPDRNLDGSTYQLPPVTKGQWAVTVDLPIVPAAGGLADTGDVLFWSAFRPDLFGGGTGYTQTAVWNPTSQSVSQATITNTKHDMFCPGISIDATGRIVVMGGNDNKKTSIYRPATNDWVAAAQMQIGRGYQSQVTLSDGRIFTIGGSWSGGYGGKNGEVYDPTTDVSSLRSGCSVTPMLTNDAQGAFRTDNHAWLFAWKNQTILQAGPSSAMNWYDISGTGSYTAAGKRASDPDSMCGNAVMYDAVAGKILTVGGSPSYQDSSATNHAHLITIGDPKVAPKVEVLSNMAYARSFGNSVVLPDGKVLVLGGQSYAIPFTDTTPSNVAELWDPATKTFTQLNPAAVPRTYHSIALLLPDATVLSGGGGLCGTGCEQNHFDGQIFRPPYLFTSTGAAASRPVISSVSASSVDPGSSITVTTDRAVSSFSMIRVGSSTHTVNTDQRRVPLTATQGTGNSYTMKLPADPGILIPGYWMLFAVDAAGVPSVSKSILVAIP